MSVLPGVAAPQSRFPIKPLETLLFATDSVAAGTFRCPTDHPLFADTGPSSTYCFVFPRTSVWIHHTAREPFLGSPHLAAFYNEGQTYCRRKLSPDGDRSDWFAVTPAIIEDVLAGLGAPPGLGSQRLFREPYVPSDAPSYLRQRQLVESLSQSAGADPLFVEETIIELLETLLRRTGDRNRSNRDCAATRRQGALVNDAKSLLVERVGDRLEIGTLARALDCSAYHLCRTFHRIAGTTIHGYQTELRLRLALEDLGSSRRNITRIALNLGFSSHSHFTAAFRRSFQLTPSRFAALIDDPHRARGLTPLEMTKTRPE